MAAPPPARRHGVFEAARWARTFRRPCALSSPRIASARAIGRETVRLTVRRRRAGHRSARRRFFHMPRSPTSPRLGRCAQLTGRCGVAGSRTCPPFATASSGCRPPKNTEITQPHSRITRKSRRQSAGSLNLPLPFLRLKGNVCVSGLFFGADTAKEVSCVDALSVEIF